MIAATLPLNPATFDYIDVSITYTILIPAALLLLAIFGAGPRRLLEHLWKADLIFAVVAIGWDLASQHPARAMSLNPPMVFGNMAIVLASLCAARASEDLVSRRMAGRRRASRSSR